MCSSLKFIESLNFILVVDADFVHNQHVVWKLFHALSWFEFLRAAAYTQMRQFNEAIKDCLKSIEIDPNYSKAYSRLGLAYYAQGKYGDAISKGFKKGKYGVFLNMFARNFMIWASIYHHFQIFQHELDLVIDNAGICQILFPRFLLWRKYTFLKFFILEFVYLVVSYPLRPLFFCSFFFDVSKRSLHTEMTMVTTIDLYTITIYRPTSFVIYQL